MKKLLTTLLVSGIVAFGASVAQAADTAPKTVIHVVTVDFKKDATPEQIQAAIDGVKKLPSDFKGITRTWTRTIKNQSGRSHVFVMEFASEQALKEYADSDAQKKWYDSYLPIRERSATSDITN